MLWGSETYGMLEEYPLIQAVFILGSAIWSDLDLGSSSICPTHWGGSVLECFRAEQSSKSQGSFINQQDLLKIGRDCPQQKKYHPWKIYGLEDVYISFQQMAIFWYLCEISGGVYPSRERSLLPIT